MRTRFTLGSLFVCKISRHFDAATFIVMPFLLHATAVYHRFLMVAQGNDIRHKKKNLNDIVLFLAAFLLLSITGTYKLKGDNGKKVF